MGYPYQKFVFDSRKTINLYKSTIFFTILKIEKVY